MSGSNLISCFTKIRSFWIFHPAWYFAAATCLGTALVVAPNIWLHIPLIAFLVTSPKTLNSLITGLIVILAAISYVSTSVTYPLELKSESIELRFRIHSVQKKTMLYGHVWIYKGSASGAGFSRVPISLTLLEQEGLQRPPANKDYLIHGVLKEIAPRTYQLKINRETPWIPIDYTWSLAERRYLMKNDLVAYIEQNYPDRSVANFLSGMCTGLLDDRAIGYDFSRFGLQHILAISGFHFALIVLLLQGFTRVFLPLKASPYILILAMTAYFIFLGPSSSIIRAWIACLFPLIGKVIHRPANSLNILAIGLIAALVCDPYAIVQPGFQFSFATTFCILVYLKPIDAWLTGALHKRSLEIAITMSPFNQYGYLISTYLRQALSLTLAVNLAVLPLSLFHFEQIPLLSFLYNLFFPLLVTLSILLFIVGATLPFTSLLHRCNNLYTRFVLNFTSEVPTSMDFLWNTDLFGTGIALSYFTLLLFLGFVVEERERTLALR